MNPWKSYKWLRWALLPLAYLPLSVLYILSDIIYLLCYYVIGYRRRVVRRNLQLVYPDMSPEERRKIERRFYKHFGDCVVETIKLLHISDEEIHRRVEICDAHLVEQVADAGRPVILYLGHYGNWEWVPQITQAYARPTVSGQIFRPLSSRVMDLLMLSIRSRFPSKNIPQYRAIRDLLKMRREHKTFLVGFIADQRPNSAVMKYWCTFLGQESAYNHGGEEIGNRVDAQYLYLDVEKLRRGHYRLTFKEIIPLDDGGEYPYTRAFLKMLEQTIHRAPQYWLWSHNRWKFARPQETNNENQ